VKNTPINRNQKVVVIAVITKGFFIGECICCVLSRYLTCCGISSFKPISFAVRRSSYIIVRYEKTFFVLPEYIMMRYADKNYRVTVSIAVTVEDEFIKFYMKTSIIRPNIQFSIT